MKKPMLLLVLGVAIFLPTQADACTIPVFRYALEKWDLTRYEILVYHHGKLPTDLARTLGVWDNAPNKANIDVSILDLDDEIDPKLLKHWKREGKDAKGPWMLVRYKEAGAEDLSAWSGPCTVDNFNALLESPLRRAILAHLTRGASGVYILMTSDDGDKDREAYTALKEQLQILEKKIQLPEQSTDGPQMILPIPLKMSLPLLVLDRKNPAEAAFAKLLLATEEGLDKAKGPILFPIFGRGRVLCSLSGTELTEKNLLVTTQFLCGKCSCELKAANPGVDMLLSGNWNEIFDCMFEGKECIAMPAETYASLPVDALRVASVPAALPVAPKACCEPTASESPETPAVECPMCEFSCPIARNWHWIASGAAGIMIVGAGIWTFCLLRK